MNINQIMFLLLLLIGVIIFLILLADSKKGVWTMNDLYIAILSIVALILLCLLAYIVERYNKLE